MPYQPEPPPTKRQAKAAEPAADKSEARYKLTPEYSLETWKAPPAVQDTIEKFVRRL